MPLLMGTSHASNAPAASMSPDSCLGAANHVRWDTILRKGRPHVPCVLLVNSHRQALRLVQIVPLDLFQRLALQPVLHVHLGSIQVKVHQLVSVVHLEHLHQ